MADPQPGLKRPEPRTNWQFGRLEWRFFLAGVALIVAAAVLAVLDIRGNVWSFVDALALAVGTAFSLAGAIARVTRDISMRLDIAQRAAEAIEDRISERLTSLANSIGVDPPSPPTTPRVPRPDPWRPVSASHRPNPPTPTAKRRLSTMAVGVLVLLAVAAAAVVYLTSGPTTRHPNVHASAVIDRPRLRVPLKSFRNVIAIHLLRSCGRPLSHEGDWIAMDCTDSAGNSVVFNEVLAPDIDPTIDTRPGPSSGCSTATEDGSSAERPSAYGLVHLACNVGYGATFDGPSRYTSEIDFDWWYRSMPLVYAELRVVRYSRRPSSPLPDWADAYRRWLRDMAALQPPSYYLSP
jgi:hypothetical protein